MIVEENTVMPAEGDIYVADFDIDKLDSAESLSNKTNLETHTVNQDYLDCFGFDKLDENVLDTESESDNKQASLEDVLLGETDAAENDKDENDMVKSDRNEEDLETAQAVDNIPEVDNKKIIVVCRVDLKKPNTAETISKEKINSNADTVCDSEVAVKEVGEAPVCGKCLFVKQSK